MKLYFPCRIAVDKKSAAAPHTIWILLWRWITVTSSSASAALLASQPFLQTCYYHCLCSNIDKLHRIIHWEKLLYSYTSQLPSQPVDCKAVLQKFIVCGKDKGFIKRLYQILFAETDHFSSIVFDMYFEKAIFKYLAKM